MKKTIMLSIILFFSAWNLFSQPANVKIIAGRPPQNWRGPSSIPNPASGDVILQNVPAYDWCYGCSPTSAAMLLGYYDHNNYDLIYTGPEFNGWIPNENVSFWGTGECPLSASHQGIDGRLTRGNVDDYWGNPDPFIEGNWDEHSYGDCVADYMGTSQNYWNVPDGGTAFLFLSSGEKLYDNTQGENLPNRYKDGCHGIRQFIEARGYTVKYNYNQATNTTLHPNSNGFTYEDFKNEINNNRPVLLSLTGDGGVGHSMVAYGYNDNNDEHWLWINDTWDNFSHKMHWDGLYSSYNLFIDGITVIELNPSPYGINDYVTITDGTTPVNLGANYGYSATFTSAYGNSNPQYYDWYLQLKKSDGDFYTVAYQRNISTLLTNSWAGTMPLQIPNYDWIRNDNGNLQGRVLVRVLDSDNYEHIDEFQIEVPYGPPVPQIFGGYYENGQLFISYYTHGADQYKLFYDVDSSPPYSGTGAIQGNSPINTGLLTTSPLGGLNTCSQYYFSVKGLNSQGESDYANEKKTRIFTPTNANDIIKYHFNDEVLFDNISWNDDHYFLGNLIIECGANVTILGGTLYFDENSKIIIKPGGKLVLNGATCTSPCGLSWQGIEVWGNSSQHQFTINGQCYQGTVELKSGTVIENACNAIRLWHPGDFNSMGGIVRATNTNFKNNQFTVDFMRYHNFNPVNPQIQMSNFGYFSNCQFVTDDNYIIPYPFYDFISMWDVEGIRIIGCSFKNLKINNNSNRGYGIRSMDAKYNVVSYCSSPVLPCPTGSLIKSEFQGLYAGIEAQNSVSTKTTYVNDAIFRDNSYGVKLNAVSNSRIIFSHFYIGPNTNCPNFTGIGVELNNCNGYSVEENEFTFSNTWPIGADFIGIRVIGSESPSSVLYNEIYHNNFIGITAGNVAEGYNGILNPPFSGLCYICNHNQPNLDYDFYIKSHGIAMYQGSNAVPAGNVFAHTNFNPFSDINNQGTWSIVYQFWSGNPGSLGVPGEQPIYTNNVFSSGTTNQNPCLSNYGTGNQTMKLTDAQITNLEQQFANNSVAYDNVFALYETLKDGGSTEIKEATIVSSTPSQTMELRDELLGNSPHLSKDVLKMAADKYDVLPDAILFEILSANPDELRNEELLTHLAKRTPPFPDYMIELLKTVASGSSYKTTLQKQLSSFNANKTKAVYALLRDMLIDTVPELTNVRNWLDNLQNIQADYQIIDSYLEQKNTVPAMALVNMLPQLYTMDADAQAEYDLYKDLKTIQSDLINEEKNIYDLSQAQITELQGIAQNSKSLAGVQAQNILSFAYGYAFLNCAEIVNHPKVKSAKKDLGELLKKVYEPQVGVSPNPAHDWAAFTYNILTSLDNPFLQITDMKGHLITTLDVKISKGELIWDTREVTQGIYCYTLTNGNYSTSGKIVIVH
ncbi:MAG: T9SS type A sorting domain-containing protein [Bacteroidales bacterium]|jgi:hypothetical protein|nr:T9SS type A sorting domain-containing protein [Bacteroidales bacterium]